MRKNRKNLQKNGKPWFKKPSRQVSERMRKVRSSGTKLEQAMERLLKEQKIKYERQLDLPGRPDFRIKGYDIVMFCDSSFWHGRRKKEINGEAFKMNKDFWIKKLKDNRKRDARANRLLRKAGWSVLRFWDTDISENKEKVIKRILKKIEKK